MASWYQHVLSQARWNILVRPDVGKDKAKQKKNSDNILRWMITERTDLAVR